MRTFLDLYQDYKNGYDKLKNKKDFYMTDEKKYKNKIEKINKKILEHQKRFANLWLNIGKENKNE